MSSLSHVIPPCQRCTRCSSLDVPLDQEESGQILTFELKENFRQLEKSAVQGCDLCQFVYRELVYAVVDISVLYDSTAPIHFDSDFSPRSQGWYLRCGDIEAQLRAGPPADPETYNEVLPINSFAATAANFDLATKWIQQCNEQHKNCFDFSRNGGLLPILPHRVIDVGHPGEQKVKLRITKGERGRYLTLSHCWGIVDHACKLSLADIDNWCQEIPQEIIPQTFLDAIEVTRRLNQRFLWIDSCCIIQPKAEDKIDWQVEGSCMVDIYRNSYCNIAASAAMSSDTGFLGIRHGTKFPLRQCVIGTTSSQSPSMVLRPNRPAIQGKLYSRAWVLQEELLPGRCIHWVREALYWTCCSHFASEFAPVMDTRNRCRYGSYVLQNLLQNADSYNHSSGKKQDHTVVTNEMMHWKSLVKSYTSRQMTVASDRLAGIAGLAHAMAMRTTLSTSRYLAGLWEGMLYSLLQWSSVRSSANVPCRAPKDLYVAPTWSWASVIGEITWEATHKMNYRFEILDITTTPIEDPYGQIGPESGRLTVKGFLKGGFLALNAMPLCECCQNEPVRDSEDWGAHVCEVAPSKPLAEHKAELIWDVLPERKDDAFHCFLYGDFRGRHYWQYAWALKQKRNKVNEFERVGWVCLGPTFEESFERCEAETIVIV